MKKMRKAELNYLVDMVIALGFLFSAISGMVFLFGGGGYEGGKNLSYRAAVMGLSRETWDLLHTWSSLVMIAGVALHFVLHWRWIICMTKNIFGNKTPTSEKESCPLE